MLFLLSVDDEHSTVRFHHLLAELLLGELPAGTRHVSRLHRDTAAVFESHGDMVAPSATSCADHHDRAFAITFTPPSPARIVATSRRRRRGSTVPVRVRRAPSHGCSRSPSRSASGRGSTSGRLGRSRGRPAPDRPAPPRPGRRDSRCPARLLVSCHDVRDDSVEYGRLTVEAVDHGLDLGPTGTGSRSTSSGRTCSTTGPRPGALSAGAPGGRAGDAPARTGSPRPRRLARGRSDRATGSASRPSMVRLRSA